MTEQPTSYAIGTGNGQFLSAASIHVSGKKGTTINFSFCESVANGKRSAAVLFDYEHALHFLGHLKWTTHGADKFTLVKCVEIDGQWTIAESTP